MTTSPRIMLVCTQMEAGGVQVRATRMLAALRREGYEASLVFLYTKRAAFTGTPGVTSLSTKRPLSALDLIRNVLRLLQHFLRHRPTVVVGFAHFASPLSAFAGALAGAPVRVATQANPPRTFGWLAQTLDLLAGLCGAYTANIAASESTRAYFARYPKRYQSRLRTVLNGVDWKPSTLTKREARDQFGIPQDKFVLINTGRLARQKNQAFLLELMPRIPDAHLAILGDGELRQELEAHIQQNDLMDRVTMVGEVAPERVPDFLAAGDVFAFPSRFEAFGLAAAEAMLAGLPIIATDEPGLREVVGSAGILLPLSSEDAWLAAIERLRTDPAASAQLGRLAAERGQRYSFSAMLDGFKIAMRLDRRSDRT